MTASPPREGRYAGAHHLALLAGLSREKASGLLEIRAGRREALIVFLGGRLIWAETNDPDLGVGPALLAAGILDRPTLEVGQREVGPDEDALLEWVAEKLRTTRASLEGHRIGLMRARVGSGLSWESGTFRFQAAPQASLEGVDPRLLPELDLARIGWEAVRGQIAQNTVRADVGTAGAWVAGPDLDAALYSLQLGPGLRDLPALLRKGMSTSRLIESVSDEATLLPLLWLLERGGWAWRKDAGKFPMEAPSPVPIGSPILSQLAVERGSRKGTLPTSLRDRWRARDQEDLYTLLGVRPYASIAAIERGAKERLAEWSPVLQDSAVPLEEKELAAQLCGAVEFARHTLSDDARREAYDLERASGNTGTVGAICRKLHGSRSERLAAQPPNLEQVHRKVAAKDWIGAWNALQPLVAAFPGQAEVTAEHALVIWNLREHAHFDVEPKELLRGVLEDDPTHPRAREVWDLIQLEESTQQGSSRTNPLRNWVRR